MGLNRGLKKSVEKKTLVTPEVLKNLRFACFSSLQYFMAAQFEEIADLKIGNVKSTQAGNLEIEVVKLKNHQFGGLFCLVTMVGARLKSFVGQNLVLRKKGNKLQHLVLHPVGMHSCFR